MWGCQSDAPGPGPGGPGIRNLGLPKFLIRLPDFGAFLVAGVPHLGGNFSAVVPVLVAR